MDQLAWIGEILVVAVLLAVLPIGWLAARRRWLSRQGGMFDCSLRSQRSPAGTGWSLGLARYRNDDLEWFRALGLSLRPRQVFVRGAARAGAQRRPTPVEAVILFDDQRILELANADGPFELAMNQDVLTGLLSWLEAAPPGMSYRPGPR